MYDFETSLAVGSNLEINLEWWALLPITAHYGYNFDSRVFCLMGGGIYYRLC